MADGGAWQKKVVRQSKLHSNTNLKLPTLYTYIYIDLKRDTRKEFKQL